MTKTDVTVLASVSDYGVSSKELRGVMDVGHGLPDALRPIQRSLAQMANRLNVDLNSPDLEKSFAAAFERRAQVKSQLGSEPGPSLG